MTEPLFVAAPRRRLLRVGAVGFGLGVVGTVLLSLVGPGTAAASATVFSLGALVFGFGLAAWATALMVGNAIRRFLLQGSTQWTRQGAARAFSILTAVGFGTMVGSTVATVLLQWLSIVG